MTRYFFNVVQGDYILDDNEGSELAALEAVRAEAVESAREMMANKLLSSGHIEDRSFWIRDESGKTVLTLPFLDILWCDSLVVSTAPAEICQKRWIAQRIVNQIYSVTVKVYR